MLLILGLGLGLGLGLRINSSKLSKIIACTHCLYYSIVLFILGLGLGGLGLGLGLGINRSKLSKIIFCTQLFISFNTVVYTWASAE